MAQPVAAIGILAALPVVAADAPARTRVAVMKEMSVHVKAIGACLKGSENPKKSTALGTAAARKIESAAATGEKKDSAAAMHGFGNAARGGCHSDVRGQKPAKTM